MSENDELNSFFAKKDKKAKSKTVIKPAVVQPTPVAAAAAPVVTATASPKTTSVHTSTDSTPTVDSPSSEPSITSPVTSTKVKAVVDLSQSKQKDVTPITNITELKESKLDTVHIPSNMRWAEKTDSHVTPVQVLAPNKSIKSFPTLASAMEEKKKPEIDHVLYVNQDKEQDPQEPASASSDSSSKKSKKPQSKPKKKSKQELEAEALMKELGLEEEKAPSKPKKK
ncbi:hypothetical protein SAMD00019534_080220 [Acytostelium subglobosum LB1]|uniref:hypothetical protein n=1 Tax=Acytostelium subglobosum LB1 TaxID=1410327 RepID=UPI000645055D|nr:hypothetical protein SAMD00019534_080220 [Acytostelium subglobosum LB1]GAM24847.1 hypothetical protein SAMD00019534_080220 [Acytostelium subglobosum LB1]|eukprot:XP_012751936.1 hypothetical protein SAMD00019534_080220 [Acytostelium subglobosum LB1]